MRSIRCDVVVIGAGAAGLSAAHDLARAGRSVTVLEARDRAGGRLWTQEVDGAVLELGGQWVSPDQDALLELLDELGLETFPRYRDGAGVYVDADGNTARFEDDRLPVPDATARRIDELVAEVDQLVAEVGAEEPWAHPRATELDRVSFATWLESRTGDREARDNVAMLVAAAMLTKPAHTFSLLQAVLMAASAGGLSRLADPDFILDRRVVGGLQQVPLRLAARLGDDVHYEQPVRALHREAGGVRAVTPDLEVSARQAVMAVPPNLISRVTFVPPLPRRQQQLHQHLSLGLVMKIHAVYESPFWRDAGLSGTALSPYQLVHEAYDNTNARDQRGTLVGFVSDERADTMLALPPEERRCEILSSLARYYGEQALHPQVYYESDWAAQEWTRGAYAASFDLGGLARFGPDLRAPVGPIRFACSDIAGRGFQHVDGAVRMGRGTAAAILEAVAGS